MIADLFGGRDSGALFSPMGRYRYRLWRRWEPERPHVVWVLLNPSTADAEQDDPTIRRCMGYARAWHFGGIEVVNLFALRGSDPKVIYEADDPVGPENDIHLLEAALEGELVVCAWGAHGSHQGRSAAVLRGLRAIGVVPHALKLTAGGEPGHPLYLHSSLRPKQWREGRLLAAHAAAL